MAETIRFEGSRDGTGPTTWSQREQWGTLESNRPHHARFDLPFLVEVPAGTTLPGVLDALRRLVERHEALRTTFAVTATGPPTQSVHQRGEMQLPVRDLGGEPGVAALHEHMEEFASTALEPVTGWPVRFAVLQRGKAPRWVGGVVSHLSADATALGILERDFRRLLATDAPGTSLNPVHQPLDQAAFEQSAEGRRILDRALASWRSGLQAAPRSLFRKPVGDDPGTRFPSVRLFGKGIGKDIDRVATALGVGVAAVYVAATAAIAARVASVDRCALIATCANRHTPRTLAYVGPIAQQGLIPITSFGSSFYDFVRSVWRLLRETASNSAWDPAELQSAAGEGPGRDGRAVDHYVNFRREPALPPPPGPAEQLGEGEFLCERGLPVPSTQLRFALNLRTDGGNMMLIMFADQAYVPEETMFEVARGIHSLLLKATAGDVRWR